MTIIEKIRSLWHMMITTRRTLVVYIAYERIGMDGYRYVGTLFGLITYRDAIFRTAASERSMLILETQAHNVIADAIKSEYHPDRCAVSLGHKGVMYKRVMWMPDIVYTDDACDVISEGRHRIIIDAHTDPVTCRTTVYGAHIDRR